MSPKKKTSSKKITQKNAETEDAEQDYKPAAEPKLKTPGISYWLHTGGKEPGMEEPKSKTPSPIAEGSTNIIHRTETPPVMAVVVPKTLHQWKEIETELPDSLLGLLQSEKKNTHLLYGSPDIQTGEIPYVMYADEILALEIKAKELKKFLYRAGAKENFLTPEHHFEILQQQYPTELQLQKKTSVLAKGSEKLVASIIPSFALNEISEDKSNMTEVAFITLCNALRTLARENLPESVLNTHFAADIADTKQGENNFLEYVTLFTHTWMRKHDDLLTEHYHKVCQEALATKGWQDMVKALEPLDLAWPVMAMAHHMDCTINIMNPTLRTEVIIHPQIQPGYTPGRRATNVYIWMIIDRCKFYPLVRRHSTSVAPATEVTTSSPIQSENRKPEAVPVPNPLALIPHISAVKVLAGATQTTAIPVDDPPKASTSTTQLRSWKDDTDSDSEPEKTGAVQKPIPRKQRDPSPGTLHAAELRKEATEEKARARRSMLKQEAEKIISETTYRTSIGMFHPLRLPIDSKEAEALMKELSDGIRNHGRQFPSSAQEDAAYSREIDPTTNRTHRYKIDTHEVLDAWNNNKVTGVPCPTGMFTLVVQLMYADKKECPTVVPFPLLVTDDPSIKHGFPTALEIEITQDGTTRHVMFQPLRGPQEIETYRERDGTMPIAIATGGPSLQMKGSPEDSAQDFLPYAVTKVGNYARNITETTTSEIFTYFLNTRRDRGRPTFDDHDKPIPYSKQKKMREETIIVITAAVTSEDMLNKIQKISDGSMPGFPHTFLIKDTPINQEKLSKGKAIRAGHFIQPMMMEIFKYFSDFYRSVPSNHIFWHQNRGHPDARPHTAMFPPLGTEFTTTIDTLLEAQPAETVRNIDIVIPVYGARAHNLQTYKPGETKNYLYVSYRQKQDTPLVTPADWTSKTLLYVPGTRPIYDDLGPVPTPPRRLPVNPTPYSHLLVKAPTLPVPRPSRDQQQMDALSLHLPVYSSSSSDDEDSRSRSRGKRSESRPRSRVEDRGQRRWGADYEDYKVDDRESMERRSYTRRSRSRSRSREDNIGYRASREDRREDDRESTDRRLYTRRSRSRHRDREDSREDTSKRTDTRRSRSQPRQEYNVSRDSKTTSAGYRPRSRDRDGRSKYITADPDSRTDRQAKRQRPSEDNRSPDRDDKRRHRRMQYR